MGLCYVACGRIDAYQCDGLYPWDAAAGTLIVREAGGHVVDSSGKLLLNYFNPNKYKNKYITLVRHVELYIVVRAHFNLKIKKLCGNYTACQRKQATQKFT